MSDSKFWFDERLGEEKETPPTQNVLDILDLFALLNIEEKISAKKLIAKEKLL